MENQTIDTNLMAENAALLAEVARLRAEAAAAKLARTPKLSCKVSDKGALSLYGMGRFPVTLYREQWTKLLDHADAIRAFILANNDALKFKAE